MCVCVCDHYYNGQAANVSLHWQAYAKEYICSPPARTLDLMMLTI